MYVEIHAQSETDEDSAGKTMWVNSRSLEMQVARTEPEHLGRPRWHVEIQARSTIEYSSGALGGDYRGVTRTLKLHLTPADLTELLALAHAAGLLTLGVNASAEEGAPR